MRASIFLAIAATALVGCAASPVYEGGRAWKAGWREGKVEKIGTASELGHRTSFDCRYENGGLGHEARGQFALVGIMALGRHRHHVVPVESGDVPQIGAPVLTKWRSCEFAIARSGK